jgi:DNA-binding MarR family transcriptional regulator
MSNYFPPALDPIAEAKRQWTVHGWEAAAPGMAAVTTIVRVNQIVMSEVEEALAPLGLSFARFEILRLLGFSRQGRLPMGKIGQRLQVHPASVTSAVKRLERDRLVRRAGHPDDNRIIMAGILPRGRSRLDDATKRINQIFESLGMTADQLDQMTSLLNLLRARAGDPVARYRA